jgi:hypothetical protein
MQRYLSTAISKMEKDEKKTQEDWIIPTNLQTCSIPGPRDQYLVRRSSSVRGIVNEHSRMSDRARLAMNMFLVVSFTWDMLEIDHKYTVLSPTFLVRKATSIAILPNTPNTMKKK